jgi:hypothetical protein
LYYMNKYGIQDIPWYYQSVYSLSETD